MSGPVVRRAVAGVVGMGGLAASAGIVRAHEVTPGEFTAPVPLSLVLVGAGVTVALTAGWLALGRTTEREPRELLTVPPRPARVLGALARSAVLVLFVAALAHGLVGRQVPAENLATLTVWPLVVKGVGVVAILAGSPWRTLSPWETLYDLLVALEGREIALVGSYPSWLAAWPAVAGFVLGIGILENLTVATRSPTLTVVIAGGYTAVMLAGGVAFGRRWFARADALAVLFDLLGRVAVLDVERTEDGGLRAVLRPPWVASARPLADASLVAFVVAMVYTVSFDGFTATRAYQRLLFDVRPVLGSASGVALYVVGLAAFVLSFLAAAALVERLATGRATDWRGAARAFGGTVVPIAAAYEIAHNYPFVVANLGGALTVVRDAVIGAHGDVIVLLGWLSTPAFWGSQVLLIVGGHLVAVVAAHRVAVRRHGAGRPAGRGHAPLVVVMVGYTILSLWIVSQPLVG